VKEGPALFARVSTKILKAERGSPESKWTVQFTNASDKLAPLAKLGNVMPTILLER